MSLKRPLLLLVAVLALGAGAIAYADDGSQGNSTATASANSDGAASDLRATLTAALQEHVYLAGFAVAAGVGDGLDSKAFKAAARALDGNSKGLAAAIGSVYGEEAGDAFLPLWRNHIGMFVAYTKAKATKNRRAERKAERDLDRYRTTFGQFLAQANPNLTAEAVAAELKPHVASVFAAIDAVVAGKAPYAKLRRAASHMPGTAEVLASAISAQFPERFPAS